MKFCGFEAINPDSQKKLALATKLTGQIQEGKVPGVEPVLKLPALEEYDNSTPLNYGIV